MRLSGVWQIGLGGVFCCGAVLAGLALWQEVPAVVYDPTSAAEGIIRAETMSLPALRPRSLRLQQRLLMGCDDMLVSPHLTLASQLAQERIIDSCLGVSEAVLRNAPTSSLAYLVQAEAWHRRGAESAAVLQGYKQSVALGPNEAWLAARRLRFGVPLKATFGAQAMALIQQDFQLVASAAPYRPLITQLYLAQPPARGWVRAQLAQLAPQTLKKRGGAGD